MHFWNFCNVVGILPYPVLRCSQLLWVFVPLALVIYYAKYDMLSTPDEVDIIQGVLNIIRGTFEMCLALLHTYRIHSERKIFNIVMDYPGMREVKLAGPLSMAVGTNSPLILFCFFAIYNTRFMQPICSSNFALLIVDLQVSFIIVQYKSMLDHLSMCIRKEIISIEDLFEKSRKFYDLIDLGRYVERLFRVQNFWITTRFIHSLLYSLYMYIRFSSDTIFHSGYRFANIGTHVANFYLLIGASENFRSEANNFTKDLFRKMRAEPSLCSNKKLTMYALGKHNVKFTGYKSFELDFELLQTMLAVSASYFFVMNQYKVPADVIDDFGND